MNNQTQAKQFPNIQSPSKKLVNSPKNWLRLAIVIIFAVIVGGGTLVWQSWLSLPESTQAPTPTIPREAVPDETAGSFRFTREDWTRYIRENKDLLDARFNLDEEYHRRACEYYFPSTSKCINYSAFPMEAYLPSDCSRSPLHQRGLIEIGDTTYFVSGGIYMGGATDNHVIGSYHSDSKTFSVLGNKITSGDPALFHFSTSEGEYLVDFVIASGAGASILSELNVYDLRTGVVINFRGYDSSEIGLIDKKISDQELLSKINSFIQFRAPRGGTSMRYMFKSNKAANWKTYRNEELGFEVQYPPDWILNDTMQNISTVSPGEWLPLGIFPQGSAQVSFGRTGQSSDALIAKWFGLGANRRIVRDYNPMFGEMRDQRIIEYTCRSCRERYASEVDQYLPGEAGRVIFFNKRNDAFYLWLSCYHGDPRAGNYAQVFNAMLSTFRFLE